MDEAYELDATGAHARFLPHDGARLAHLRLGRQDLLVDVPTADPLWWGAFVMAPWASRLEGGEFEFRGQRVRLPTTHESDTWHGIARRQAWRRARHVLSTDLVAWPFGGRVDLSAYLTDALFRLELSMTATTTTETPGALGWHPWFRRRLADDPAADVRVHLPAGMRVQVRDEHDRPTGHWVPADAVRRHCRPGTGGWNDCVSLVWPVVLEWPGCGYLSIASNAAYAILFTTADEGVCVEPCTSPAGHLGDVLGAGDRLALSVELEWRPGPYGASTR